jgi:hypothetical protein
MQLLLIKTARTGVASVGDIVGVFDDKHVFSPAEIDGFDIVKNTKFTKEQFISNAASALTHDMTGHTAVNDEGKTYLIKMPKHEFNVKDKSAITLATTALQVTTACKSNVVDATSITGNGK